MGVKGLWDLLAPAGRRVSAANLKGKIVAVDAAIWLVQFLHAMKRADGSALPAAHLVGFFNRLCRKRQRLQQEKSLRSVVARLLVNRLRAQRNEGSSCEPAGESNSTVPSSNIEPEVIVVSGTTSGCSRSSDVRSVSPSPSPPPSSHASSGHDRSLSSLALCPGDGEEKGRTTTTKASSTEGGATPAVLRLDRGDQQKSVSSHEERRRKSDTEEEASELISDSDGVDDVSVQGESRGRSLVPPVPEELRGFLSSRRQLGELPMPSILSMPASAASTKAFGSLGLPNLIKQSRDGESRKLVRRVEDFKAYRLEDDTYVQLPLDAEIDPEVFELLPPKMQFQILTQLRDAWMHDSRVKALQAKNNIFVFSNVQLESYMRSVQANLQLTAVKQRLAAVQQAQEGEGESLSRDTRSVHVDTRALADSSDTPGPSDFSSETPAGGTASFSPKRERRSSLSRSSLVPVSPSGTSLFSSPAGALSGETARGRGRKGGAQITPSRIYGEASSSSSLSGGLFSQRALPPKSTVARFARGRGGLAAEPGPGILGFTGSTRQRVFMNDLEKASEPLSAPSEAETLRPSELIAAAAARARAASADDSSGGKKGCGSEVHVSARLKKELGERETRRGVFDSYGEEDDDGDGMVLTATGERRHIALLDDKEIFGEQFFANSPTASAALTGADSQTDFLGASEMDQEGQSTTPLLPDALAVGSEGEGVTEKRSVTDGSRRAEEGEETQGKEVTETEGTTEKTSGATQAQEAVMNLLSEEESDEFEDCVIDSSGGSRSVQNTEDLPAASPSVLMCASPVFSLSLSCDTCCASSFASPGRACFPVAVEDQEKKLDAELRGSAWRRRSGSKDNTTRDTSSVTLSTAKASSVEESSGADSCGSRLASCGGHRGRMRRKFWFGGRRPTELKPGAEPRSPSSSPSAGALHSCPKSGPVRTETEILSRAPCSSVFHSSLSSPGWREQYTCLVDPLPSSTRGKSEALYGLRKRQDQSKSKTETSSLPSSSAFSEQESALRTRDSRGRAGPRHREPMRAGERQMEKGEGKGVRRPRGGPRIEELGRFGRERLKKEEETGNSGGSDCQAEEGENPSAHLGSFLPGYGEEEVHASPEAVPETIDPEKLLAELGKVSFPLRLCSSSTATISQPASMEECQLGGGKQEEKEQLGLREVERFGGQDPRRNRGGDEEDGFMQLWLAVFPQLKEHLPADHLPEEESAAVGASGGMTRGEQSDDDNSTSLIWDRELGGRGRVNENLFFDEDPDQEPQGNRERRGDGWGGGGTGASAEEVAAASSHSDGEEKNSKDDSRTPSHAHTASLHESQQRQPATGKTWIKSSSAVGSGSHRSPVALMTMGGSGADERLRERLEEEKLLLFHHAGGLMQRQTGDVNAQMKEQVIALLRAFGIPFVTAPGEAEATAAHLTLERLADADDSDTVVFGAQEVYRNFFENKKSVEVYEASFTAHKLGLDQEALILLAMILGCDYTLGVRGIGIVNAVEVLRAFPSLEALEKFRTWAEAPWTAGIDADDSEEVRKYKEEHKNYRLQWQFPHDFPSPEVFEAFASPLVDRSREPFSWAAPDVDSIVAIMTRVGGLKKDEVLDSLLPALKQYGAADAFQRQTRLTAFLPFADTGGHNEKNRSQGGTPGDREHHRTGDALRAAAQALAGTDCLGGRMKEEAPKKKEKKDEDAGREENWRGADTKGGEDESILEGIAIWMERDEGRKKGKEQLGENTAGGGDTVAVIKSERMLRAVSVLERRRKQATCTSEEGDRHRGVTSPGRSGSIALHGEAEADRSAALLLKSSRQGKRKRAPMSRRERTSQKAEVERGRACLRRGAAEEGRRGKQPDVAAPPGVRGRRTPPSSKRKRDGGPLEASIQETMKQGQYANVSRHADLRDEDGILIAEMERDLAVEDLDALAAAAEAELL